MSYLDVGNDESAGDVELDPHAEEDDEGSEVGAVHDPHEGEEEDRVGEEHEEVRPSPTELVGQYDAHGTAGTLHKTAIRNIKHKSTFMISELFPSSSHSYFIF